jgi:GNAT superfamily N-acetyltransferase
LLTCPQRYYIWKDRQHDAHSAVWTDPRGYYFLNIMVVLPEAQGRGIGKKLVTVVTDRADAEDMPCYLESSRDKPNMQIYERMGFRFAKQMDCDDDGQVCKLYCMVREPRQGPPEDAVGTPAAETHPALL